jgi:hypothetical protein
MCSLFPGRAGTLKKALSPSGDLGVAYELVHMNITTKAVSTPRTPEHCGRISRIYIRYLHGEGFGQVHGGNFTICWKILRDHHPIAEEEYTSLIAELAGGIDQQLR